MIAIQQAFRPLFIMCFFIGLGIYPVKELRSKFGWILYLSILYSLIIWFVYGCLWYYMVSCFSVNMFFRTAFSITVMAINIITTIISVILCMYYNKRFMICMKKLAAVDDTLEKLGDPKIYQKIYVWSKRIVIGWIVYTFAINFYDILWWLRLHETISYWAYIIPHIYNYSYHVSTYVDLIFILFMWYIGTRFDKVHKHVQYLIMKEEYMLKSRWKSIVNVHRHTLCTNNYKQMLWSSMHLHLELCHIARELNQMFGMQMTLEMASYLIFLTAICYFFYKMEIIKSNPERLSVESWIRMFFWIIMYISRICITNYICENISVKANKIDKIIHQLTNDLRYADMWQEMYQFILRAMHHPLKFTGMGLFTFGNEFLRKFCLTIIMFVIIILQMEKV